MQLKLWTILFLLISSSLFFWSCGEGQIQHPDTINEEYEEAVNDFYLDQNVWDSTILAYLSSAEALHSSSSRNISSANLSSSAPNNSSTTLLSSSATQLSSSYRSSSSNLSSSAPISSSMLSSSSAPAIYALTLPAQVNGAGNYYAGDTITLNAPDSTAEHRCFNSWSNAEIHLLPNYQSDELQISLLMPAYPLTISYSYSDCLYTLTYDDGSFIDSVHLSYQTTRDLSAADNNASSQCFDHWDDDGSGIISNPSQQNIQIAMPDYNLNITAIYSDCPSSSSIVSSSSMPISSSSAGPILYDLTLVNGTISATGTSSGQYAENEIITIIADNRSDISEEFRDWTVSAPYTASFVLTSTTASTTSLTMPAGNITLTANYNVLSSGYYDFTINALNCATDLIGTNCFFTDPSSQISGSQVLSNTELQIYTAEPIAGQCLEWRGNQPVNDPYAYYQPFTMPMADVALQTIYAPCDTIDQGETFTAADTSWFRSATPDWAAGQNLIIQITNNDSRSGSYIVNGNTNPLPAGYQELSFSSSDTNLVQIEPTSAGSDISVQFYYTP
jgi:hypothetical protein